MEACTIGIQFVWSSPLSNKIANARISTGIDDGRKFTAVGGTGNTKDIGRQAVFAVEPSYSMRNDINILPTLICSNVLLGSYTDQGRFGPLSLNASSANGRAFLFDGDILIDLTGFQVNYPTAGISCAPEVPDANRVLVRIRGFIETGNPSPDLQTDGLKVGPLNP